MLVLSRKKNESIMIGNQIELKIIGIEGDQVKLGIVAPQNVKIFRSEVYESIQQQNEEALNVPLSIVKEITKKKF